MAIACALLLLGVGAHEAAAGPANERARVELRQPGGDALVAKPYGDEWSNGLETLDGYSIVQDSAGAWEYARKAPDGGLEPSGLRAGVDDPAGLVPGLRGPTEARREPLGGDNFAPLAHAPNAGTHRALVILAQFADRTSLGTTPANWNARFFGATNSVADYYDEVSYGDLTFAPAAETSGTANDGVVGWVTLARNHPRAIKLDDVAQGLAARETVRDAILAANSSVNFAAFDTDGDGTIEPAELHVTVIMAGWEGSSQCGTPAVWGHKWATYAQTPSPDGVKVGGDYTTFGEMQCDQVGSRQATLGIIVHELGHDLGWPDLYDTDKSAADRGGVGKWSVMASGSWNAAAGSPDGTDPAHPDPLLKAVEGWSTPTQVTGTIAGRALLQTADNRNAAVRLLDNPGGVDWQPGVRSGTGEYFLLENRQHVGYDRGLPACGVIIWHVDETRTSGTGPNADDSRRLIRVQQADADGWPFNAGDAWRGAGTFNDGSTPSSRLYSGASSNVSASGFSAACAPTMTANLSAPGTVTTPSADGFGAAARIDSLPYQHAGSSTASATVEAGEPAPSCRALGKTVWYRYTPPASGTLVADTVGSSFDTVLAVHRGQSLGALTEVGCNDDIDQAAGNVRSRVQLAVTAGQTYYVQVGGYKDQSGTPASGALTFNLAEVIVAPANDAFAAAEAAAALPFTRTGVDTRGATSQTGEPAAACAPMGRDVWYRYVAPQNATLVADTIGSGFDTVLAVYRGSTLAGLTAVACNDDIAPSGDGGGNPRSRTQFAVTGGETYLIRAGGFKNDAGEIAAGALTLNLAAAATTAPNDAFAASIAADPLPFTRASLDTRTAAIQTDETAPSCAGIGKSVWFRYVAPADGTLVAGTVGSDYDTVLAVYRGTALGALTEVACNDDIDPAAQDLRSRAQFAVSAGQTYQFQVSAFYDGTNPSVGGSLTFALDAVSLAPANDAFATASAVAALPFTRTGVDTRAATADGEPAPSCGTLGKSVWYRYVAPVAGTLTADTGGSDFDTVLAVHRGTALGALTEVACSDDVDRAGGNLSSRAQFAVTAGQTYYLQAGGYRAPDGTTAAGSLSITLASASVAPANDGFAGATAVGALPFASAGIDTRGAGVEAGEASPSCSESVGKSVWFRYVAPADGALSADTLGSDFDTVLAVHRGTALGALTEIACNDDVDRAAGNLRSRAAFTVVAGQTYYFQAAGFWDGQGPAAGGALTLHVLPPHAAIASGPGTGSLSASRSATFTFAAAGAAFECRLDGGAWTACTSPHAISGLADGAHAFDVRAVWQGQAETTPASRTWTVDATAPDTAITDGPSEGSLTGGREAAFRFSSESGATFECRLDAGPWAGCGSPRPLQELTDGGHRFEVRARDEAGNVDASPAARAWTVDGTAPDTALEGGPAEGSTTAARTATFAFAGEPGASFQCRADAGAWTACTSPLTGEYGDGGHAFEVRASDSAGNVDASPARRTWTVDGTPPDTLIVSGPAEGSATDATSTAFGFASEPDAGFECRLDGGPWIACGPAQAYSGLAVGGHRFEVRARDAAGNLDGSPAARGWTVSSGSSGAVLTASVSGQRLSGVLARGVLVRYRCRPACRPSWRVELTAAEARKVGLGRRAVVVGRATAKQAALSGSARIKLSARARKALRGRSRVQVRVVTLLDGRVSATSQVLVRR